MNISVYIDITVANGPSFRRTFDLSELLTEAQHMCHGGSWII